MYKEEIDKRLINLRKQLKDSNNQYYVVISEINDLEYEAQKLEKECEDLEREIEQLERKLINVSTLDLDNVFTGDEFRDSFIKASYFCRKYSDVANDKLEYVKIVNAKLFAIDGYRGIVINCSKIPQELKNTYIKWDTRENFKENIEKDIIWFYEINEIIDKAKSNIVCQVNADDFFKQLCVDTRFVGNREVAILEFNNKRVAFNKKYLEELLMVFGKTIITIHYPEIKTSPIIIKNDIQEALLLPIRLSEY